jgi:hypothetical protein
LLISSLLPTYGVLKIKYQHKIYKRSLLLQMKKPKAIPHPISLYDTMHIMERHTTNTKTTVISASPGRSLTIILRMHNKRHKYVYITSVDFLHHIILRDTYCNRLIKKVNKLKVFVYMQITVTSLEN